MFPFKSPTNTCCRSVTQRLVDLQREVEQADDHITRHRKLDLHLLQPCRTKTRVLRHGSTTENNYKQLAKQNPTLQQETSLIFTPFSLKNRHKTASLPRQLDRRLLHRENPTGGSTHAVPSNCLCARPPSPPFPRPRVLWLLRLERKLQQSRRNF